MSEVEKNITTSFEERFDDIVEKAKAGRSLDALEFIVFKEGLEEFYDFSFQNGDSIKACLDKIQAIEQENQFS